MPKKIRIGILFGGRSAEHEVSLQSAESIIKAIDKTKYELLLIGIGKNGQWLLFDNNDYLINVDDPKKIKLNSSGQNIVILPQNKKEIYNLSKKKFINPPDVIFPVLHGPFGEDGTIQGLLKLAGIPFVGAGILGSAVGMDKEIMKNLLKNAEVPIGKFITIRKEDVIPNFNLIKDKLGLPCFIKPANMGSSVGVNKINSKKEYLRAIKEAFMFDAKAIIEKNILGREIECSVLGNANPIASVPGEIIVNHDFYSYSAKYIDDSGATLKIPADLSKKVVEKIKKIAIKTFQALNCEGLGRVDAFLTADSEIIVNEINTIPGFTKISMYPKLWEASGISYPNLIDQLIELAVERHKSEAKLKTTYSE
ncbi:MAG: D-alanine--D-alanine ligase [Patescibacteria group bacterium]|nr:D-alanine--D-alanine ligase [Patescibacteria group bacterium]